MYHLLESYTPESLNVMDTVAIDNDSVRAGSGRQLSRHLGVEDVFFPRTVMPSSSLAFIFSVTVLISGL